MVDSVRGELRKFGDLNELSEAAAEDISRLIVKTVSGKGSFTLALSGGNTPRTLHHLLATRYREDIPWKSVTIFFGDERYVPHSDRESNYLMARETLLDLVPIPAENVHPVPTGPLDFSKSAASYEKVLRESFDQHGATFDLLILGMGKEGHTASLFPHSAALDEKEKWVDAVEVPAVPSKRLTITLPVINRSSAVYFLVSGRDKQEALKRVLEGGVDFHEYPAEGVAPVQGKLVWWVDDSAFPG